LESDRFAVRQGAFTKLSELGQTAKPLLIRERDKRGLSLETRRSLDRLLARLESLSAKDLQALRAVDALERMGTPASRALLRKLASGGPPAPLTLAAKAALHD
jgi:hypothetical protein